MHALMQLLRCLAGPPVGPRIILQVFSHLECSDSHCSAQAFPCLVLNAGVSGTGGALEHAAKSTAMAATVDNLILSSPWKLEARGASPQPRSEVT